MHVVAIIQARMGSTRLPGKVLLDLEGDTVLARVVTRMRRARLVNEVAVATSVNMIDDVIEEECHRLQTVVFRGSESDVLDRYYRAAEKIGADIVLRITADCPLIDPEVCDLTVRACLENGPDYASNTLERTYPRGLDVEVFSRSALSRAWQAAEDACSREHVTPYIYQHPEQFNLLSVKAEQDNSQHRWTLDTKEDLVFLRRVYKLLGNLKPTATWHDVLTILNRNPELTTINRHIEQKAL